MGEASSRRLCTQAMAMIGLVHNDTDTDTDNARKGGWSSSFLACWGSLIPDGRWASSRELPREINDTSTPG